MNSPNQNDYFVIRKAYLEQRFIRIKNFMEDPYQCSWSSEATDFCNCCEISGVRESESCTNIKPSIEKDCNKFSENDLSYCEFIQNSETNVKTCQISEKIINGCDLCGKNEYPSNSLCESKNRSSRCIGDIYIGNWGSLQWKNNSLTYNPNKEEISLDKII